ncbi:MULTISPECIES: P22 phage major capsid protein family protein [unclassified Nocardia]|uniref:P22 phage major capsid protein family protein n=1 Tax=unclassified Nocardia TaxID=2637762 RepID=UPI00278C79E6|nr:MULTISPECIES: P22 phage major capsid protein family protein [unclassified Nocardia]
MANTLLTPTAIARQALATLYESMVMQPLVYTDLSTEFTTQKIGDVVNVRKPAVFEATDFDRATGIQVQDVTEGSLQVHLNKIADVSFKVTSEELTLEILDFDEQLLTPAMMAIAQKIDKAILALRSDVTQIAGLPAPAGPAGFEWDKPEALIEAGRLLDLKNVPEVGRQAVVGPTTKARWLNSDLIKNADRSGSTDGLRRASVGANLFGHDVYQTQNVGQPPTSPAPGDPTTEIGVAFHPSAFAFVSAPLEIPPGATAAVESYRGLSVRVAYDYDHPRKQTIVSIDTLYGCKTLDPNRAVLIKGADQA